MEVSALQQMLSRFRQLQEDLQRQVNAQAERVSRNAAVPDAERRLNKLLTTLEETETEVRRNSPRYAALTQPAPLDVKAPTRTPPVNDSGWAKKLCSSESSAPLKTVTFGPPPAPAPTMMSDLPSPLVSPAAT